jgi:hypothetical protein
MKTILTLLFVVLMSACATPYGKYGLLGGFRDSRIDENTFSISVDTNGFTSQQTTSMQALYRAAELTVQSGFDFFVIAGGGSNPSSMMMAMPGATTSNTTLRASGSYGYATTTTTAAPTMYMPMIFPNATLVIKAYRGDRPADLPGAYDARSVMKYLGPQINPEVPK